VDGMSCPPTLFYPNPTSHLSEYFVAISLIAKQASDLSNLQYYLLQISYKLKTHPIELYYCKEYLLFVTTLLDMCYTYIGWARISNGGGCCNNVVKRPQCSLREDVGRLLMEGGGHNEGEDREKGEIFFFPFGLCRTPFFFCM
jgi:hypothetical protein